MCREVTQKCVHQPAVWGPPPAWPVPDDPGHVEARLWVIDRNRRARDLYERNGWVLVPGETIEELGVVEVRYRCVL